MLLLKGILCAITRGILCQKQRGILCAIIRGILCAIIKGILCVIIRGILCQKQRGILCQNRGSHPCASVHSHMHTCAHTKQQRQAHTHTLPKCVDAVTNTFYLGDVFTALNKRQQHVPYRNSKLTWLLQPCLSGTAPRTHTDGSMDASMGSSGQIY